MGGRRPGCERARHSAWKLAFARLLNATLIASCAGWANGDMGGRCVHGAGARAGCRAEDLLSCSQRDAVAPFVAPTQDVSQSGIWNLESGTWNLEPGTWNLEPGTWNLGQEGTWSGICVGNLTWNRARCTVHGARCTDLLSHHLSMGLTRAAWRKRKRKI